MRALALACVFLCVRACVRAQRTHAPPIGTTSTLDRQASGQGRTLSLDALDRQSRLREELDCRLIETCVERGKTTLCLHLAVSGYPNIQCQQS